MAIPDQKRESWGIELASIWTNYRPPCRPSLSELWIYTKYLRKIQNLNPHRKANLLILGSTAEFRDWGHEEGLNVTIIDFSVGYNETIVEQMKYKKAQEAFVYESWQCMSFEDEFDIIVGDLVVGNLAEKEIPLFLANTSRALKKGGYFITKSFFRRESYSKKNLVDIFQEYLSGTQVTHSFPLLIYDITLSCMDYDANILNFYSMYQSICKLHIAGVINDSLFDQFSSLGWQNNMKFEFYIPTINKWESMIKQEENLKLSCVEYGLDPYSRDFPIYIIQK